MFGCTYAGTGSIRVARFIGQQPPAFMRNCGAHTVAYGACAERRKSFPWISVYTETTVRFGKEDSCLTNTLVLAVETSDASRSRESEPYVVFNFNSACVIEWA